MEAESIPGDICIKLSETKLSVREFWVTLRTENSYTEAMSRQTERGQTDRWAEKL